jgi:hypothetical protein
LKFVFSFKLISAAVGRQGASSAQIAPVGSPYPACPAGVSHIRSNHQSKNSNSTYIVVFLGKFISGIRIFAAYLVGINRIIFGSIHFIILPVRYYGF